MTFDLDKLDALCAALPAGPWFARVNDLIGGWCVMPAGVPPSSGTPELADFVDEGMARFIAVARTALPELVVRVRELEEKVRVLELFMGGGKP